MPSVLRIAAADINKAPITVSEAMKKVLHGTGLKHQSDRSLHSVASFHYGSGGVGGLAQFVVPKAKPPPPGWDLYHRWIIEQLNSESEEANREFSRRNDPVAWALYQRHDAVKERGETYIADLDELEEILSCA